MSFKKSVKNFLKIITSSKALFNNLNLNCAVHGIAVDLSCLNKEKTKLLAGERRQETTKKKK